jgi:integrase
MAVMTITLSEAIMAFEADRRVKGAAAGTRRNDSRCLRMLLADIGNIHVKHITVHHLDQFWLSHSNWAPGTFNNQRSILNNFFNWCRVRGYMPPTLDPLAGTRKQRVPQQRRIIIPQPEFANVLAGCADPRQRVTFAIGLYTFARIGEIENLRWQDVNRDDRVIEVYRPKTKSLDALPMCDELYAELGRWRMTYAAMAEQTPLPGWYVVPNMSIPYGYATKGVRGFTGLADRRLLPEKKADLGRTITDGLRDQGYFQRGEGGHTLRRSGAVALYNQLSSVGHDRAIRTCQAMLGHASIQTTEIYLRLDLDRKSAHDLLAGKPMFPQTSGGAVIELGGARGSADG